MAGSTITGSTSNEYIDAQIVWYSTANKEANTSSVTAALYYRRNNSGYVTSGTGTFSITINGVTKSASKTVNITESAWVKVVENTVTVSHNSNGRRSITISGAGSIPGTSLSSTNVSKLVDLDTIARETTMDYLSCATKYFNGKITYKFTPKNPDLYNRCYIALNISGVHTSVKTISLGKQSASLHTSYITLEEGDLSVIYNKLPSSVKGTLRFTFRTYEDPNYSLKIGSDQYKEISLEIPNNDKTRPTATMTLSPVSSLSSPFNTLYIKGKSKVDANFTDATGKYGASIVSIGMKMLGKSYNSPYTSEYLIKEGSVVVEGIITDSRGFSTTYSRSITVLPYATPRILPVSGDDDIVCARCDADGNPDDSGTYLRIKAKRSYSEVVFDGAKKNFCSIRYRYKTESGAHSPWTTILETDATSNEVDTGALLNGSLDATKAFTVEIGVVDTIGETDYVTIHIPTDKVYWHRAGSINSFCFGGYVSDPNTFDIAEHIKAKLRGDVEIVGGVVDDVPVEVGTNGIWRYRKWQSGIAECWGTATISTTFNKTWGALYVCDLIDRQNYPFTFVERPAEVVTIRNNGMACWGYVESGGNGLNTKTQTAKYCAARPTSTTETLTLYIDYQVSGRWK